jgi:hypothetical protein
VLGGADPPVQGGGRAWPGEPGAGQVAPVARPGRWPARPRTSGPQTSGPPGVGRRRRARSGPARAYWPHWGRPGWRRPGPRRPVRPPQRPSQRLRACNVRAFGRCCETRASWGWTSVTFDRAHDCALGFHPGALRGTTRVLAAACRCAAGQGGGLRGEQPPLRRVFSGYSRCPIRGIRSARNLSKTL